MATRRAFATLIPIFLVLVVAPAAIAATPITREAIGRLELIHGENFDTGAAIYDYSLVTGSERIPLKFRRTAPDGFVNGARVRVRGQQVGNALVAADGVGSGTVVLETAPAYTGSRRLAVALINFSNDASKPFTRSFANGVIFSNANSVRAYFAEQSAGAMVLTGTTFDWLHIPVSNSTCDYHAWETAARAGLTARGVDLATYTNLMLVFPSTGNCGWRGLGYLPGTTTWINGAPTLRTSAHELTHNFGVHHASSLRCTANGVRVALSSSCTRSEYGDPFTTMGAASYRQDDTLARIQMGFLPPSAARTVTASGSYTLLKAFATSGTRIIGIPRGDGTWLYLEYRRPFGQYFDNFPSTSSAVNGVTIRLAKGWTTITQSSLIDTVPSTTTFEDAPLRLGHSFHDSQAGITITVTGLTTSAATLSIRLPADTIAPSVPGSLSVTATTTSSISLAWKAATDNRAVTGYQVWQDGVLAGTTGPTTLAWTGSGLAGGTSYAFDVRAVDGAGNVGPAASVTASTLRPDSPPSAVSGLTATVTATSVRLSWRAATDDVGVTAYRVWQGDVPVGTTTGTAFTISSLTPATAYSWVVRAVDTAGQLGPATTVIASTPAPDTTAPSPVVATIETINASWATLRWTPATDDTAVAGYEVLRDGHDFADVGPDVLTLRVSTGSTFAVIAVDAAGNHGPGSNAVRS